MAVTKSKYCCGEQNYASLSVGYRWFQIGFIAHSYGLRIMVGWYQWVVRWPQYKESAKPQTNNSGSTQCDHKDTVITSGTELAQRTYRKKYYMLFYQNKNWVDANEFDALVGRCNRLEETLRELRNFHKL